MLLLGLPAGVLHQVKVAPKRSRKGIDTIWQAGWECTAGTSGYSAFHSPPVVSKKNVHLSTYRGLFNFICHVRFTKRTREILMIWIHKCLRLVPSFSMNLYSSSIFLGYLFLQWLNKSKYRGLFSRELHMWYVVLELQHFHLNVGMERILQNV